MRHISVGCLPWPVNLGLPGSSGKDHQHTHNLPVYSRCGGGGVSGRSAIALDSNTPTQNSMNTNSVSTDLWTHTPIHRRQSRAWRLLCDPGHGLHNNRAKGNAKTTHRQGGGKKGAVVLLHTSVNAHTQAGVSTRLEHVPAACMLVCMCNHACCYLCGGGGSMVQ